MVKNVLHHGVVHCGFLNDKYIHINFMFFLYLKVAQSKSVVATTDRNFWTSQRPAQSPLDYREE
jgi:hypothetical protein